MKNEEFVNVVERHKGIIYKVCYVYAGSREDAVDYFQDVVAQLWQAWPRFRGESSVSTWIYRVALYTCVSHMRKSSRRPGTVSLYPGCDAAGQDDERTEQVERMYDMLSRLGNAEKALVLLWLEEKSYEEIAAITGLTRSNVAVKLMRAKDKLKKMYNDKKDE